ncbi:uncharacterized protein BXZ73DRAFT_83401 [Epithele typhae]|uniref:uncharacterized protein n=1 Tax=Epithele typhae TaxID=378194 RepID=UPI002007F97D|nr:uncharacterized protein BXZ73DRAFT_83401 [Epithele typhae]KAH9910605.1 hypothetical protein BXZ73DRAFT_83401 [Epithele typhae]
MPAPTKKVLKERIKELEHQLNEHQAQQEARAAQEGLAAAHEEAATAAEHQQLDQALAAANAANINQATAAANTAANANQGGGNVPGPVVNIIPTPHSPVSIRHAMGVTQNLYANIQHTIRTLTICSQLDWTDDFRRQDPECLAMLFRAARTAHPELRRYENNWAMAAIARQYMQNKCKHAYRQGYISKKARRRGHSGAERVLGRRGGQRDSSPEAGAGSDLHYRSTDLQWK